MITERTYSKDSYSNVRMFTGKEIEHTPAHGMQTLFVVGLMPFDAIISTAKQHNCEHIYFGANMSYKLTKDWPGPSQGWTQLIKRVLDETDYWVTLDYQNHESKFVLEQGFQEYDIFIHLISVRIARIDDYGVNACVKLDDVGFNETNRGVWVHNLKKLQTDDVLTTWSMYEQDKPI